MPKQPPPTQYSLVVAAGDGGTTVPSPEIYYVPAGYSATIKASPYTGYVFDHWGGDAQGSNPSISLTIDQNTTVVAYFAPSAQTPTSSSSSAGFVAVAGLVVAAVGVSTLVIQAVRKGKK